MQFSSFVPAAFIAVALQVAVTTAAPPPTCPPGSNSSTAPRDRNSPTLTCEQDYQVPVGPPDPNDSNMCVLTADINPCLPNTNNFIVWDNQCNPLAQKSIASGEDPSLWIGGLPSLDIHLSSQTFDYGSKLIGVSYVQDEPNSGISAIGKNMCNGGTSYTLKFNCREYN